MTNPFTHPTRALPGEVRMATSRRAFAAALAVTAAQHSMSGRARSQVSATPVAIEDELVIDMAGPPDNLDPALSRSIRDWSIVHAIYDSILDLDDEGQMQPLAAETFEMEDDLTYRVVLRDKLTYHDGSPVDSDAVRRSILHVQQSEGPAAGSFGVIADVELPDERTALLRLAEPSPWLPSQLAVWLVLFPDQGPEVFETAPIGSGPYRFVSRSAGSDVVLERNPTYSADSPKGQPIAEKVRYRFVPEATTRIADLAADATHIADAVPQDQESVIVDSGGTVLEAPVLGTSFLRIVNDVAPFDDPRVRQALNYAIDVETIGKLLISENVRRLASLFPDERSIGFDLHLEPFPYDPDRARALLVEAGYPDGFNTRLEYTGGGRDDVMQALAANLSDVGVNASISITELATFNGSWKAADSAPLRFVSWRPVYDPHTLLSLMFASTGPLSRYADPEADALINQGATDVDPEDRADTYRQLGAYFQESPPAVFLWNLTAIYGVKGPGTRWDPRADEYLLPLSRKDTL